LHVVDAEASDAAKASIQSQVAVVHCLTAFVRLHNEGRCMSWTNGSINVVLNWMSNGVDVVRLQQVCYTLHANRN